MSNTSATGGYLSPVSAATPEDDKALELILQGAIAGITGLPGDMVRRRWQENSPKQPEPLTDWCAFCVTDITPDAGPAITHNSSGDGSDSYVRHESIAVLAIFYGPNGMANAARLRDGLAMPQNMEALQARGMALVETSPSLSIPELVNQQWIRRYDLHMGLRRKVERTYPVLNIVSAPVDIQTDAH